MSGGLSETKLEGMCLLLAIFAGKYGELLRFEDASQ
jgi:hypothetical protein